LKSITMADNKAATSSGVLLIVSGASRGLGRAIALAFCRHFAAEVPPPPPTSSSVLRIVLLARSLPALQDTKALLVQEMQKHSKSWITSVSVHAVDLGELSSLDSSLDEVLDQTSVMNFDRLIFINNAGSLGQLGPCIAPRQELSELQKTVDLNVTSSFWASVKFARFVKKHTQARKATALIVNISSLTAIQPFPSMGLYSAGKAARDMYHACLAKELEGDQSSTTTVFKILNYAPGPLETDMTEEIRAAPELDPSLKPHYQKQLVDPNDSARVLVQVVAKNTFTSGSHVDYYDCCW